MILADAFDMNNEQKIVFAALALQAEYSAVNENEHLLNLDIEHYASSALINQVITKCTMIGQTQTRHFSLLKMICVNKFLNV
jgi:hypothetical protein